MLLLGVTMAIGERESKQILQNSSQDGGHFRAWCEGRRQMEGVRLVLPRVWGASSQQELEVLAEHNLGCFGGI